MTGLIAERKRLKQEISRAALGGGYPGAEMRRGGSRHCCLYRELRVRTPCVGTSKNTSRMDHHSCRAQLVFSIGFALSRSCDLLRRLLQEHALDNARHELAERVIKQLERSGFELDEQAGTLRKRPPLPRHSTPRWRKAWPLGGPGSEISGSIGNATCPG